ncbi:MAG: HD domain-containing protein [Zoogloeaceae bacterium]|jgi:HD-GYP domain-containing protein (c-di-GMP phosphodiesterase class II)/phosphoribosyl 1,2-cyclic phosphodiesterase|nr:HD domain-containing protein [Zoogloeaceae bacterium]
MLNIPVGKETYMEVFLRGVRGSIANPSSDTVFYGGNTACIELRADNGDLLFFDAGTGLHNTGKTLPDSGECHVFISHGHTDHIVGLWFFKPLHSPNWITHLYLPEWLCHIPDYFYDGGIFPVPVEQLKGKLVQHLVKSGEPVLIGEGTKKTIVEPFTVCHPGGALGYKVHADDALFVYSGDHEITRDPASHAETEHFLRDADIAVVDAMYNREDYMPGWGHSTWEDWVEVATRANVRNLVLSHHEPSRSDRELDALDYQLLTLNKPISAYVAREGMRFVPSGSIPPVHYGSDWLLAFLDELAYYRDENAILDRILAKAREITNADAGTIFLVEGNNLVFAYTHNDSLFSVGNAYKYAYSTAHLPISMDSIAGYAATTKESLNLPDVHHLPPEAPYKFNASFDERTGYHTHSMLTLPFFDKSGKVSGILQLINSLDPRGNKPCPFSLSMEFNARMLTRAVSSTLEYSMLERKSVYSMLHMASVHDPFETGPHAERVGAVAAELYQCWAHRRGLAPDIIRYEKSHIRLAAMLHDIGKVGISDLILKKQGRLSDEENLIMRTHTEIGASILKEDASEIALFAHDIALHHHQQWNGNGYPAVNGKPLAGEDIPLVARITAIADVFDALVSPRCYKQPWTFETTLESLRANAGTHFDPALIECMMEISDILPLIYERFPNPSGEKGLNQDADA